MTIEAATDTTSGDGDTQAHRPPPGSRTSPDRSTPNLYIKLDRRNDNSVPQAGVISAHL